jgi:beta-galactosidase
MRAVKQSLNYDWKFSAGFDSSYLKALPAAAKQVDIPHAPVVVRENDFNEEDYQGLFTYEKVFDVPLDTDHLFFLVFEGVMLQFDCYLNDKPLGHFLSGWYEVRIDVTSLLKEKANRLVVVVDGREDKQVPPFGKACDYLTFAGIYRPVYLESKPLTYLKRLDVLLSNAQGDLEIKPEISGSKTSQLSYELFDKEGKKVAGFDTLTYHLENPHRWSCDDPYLYTLKASLTAGKITDVVSRRVGFRTFEVSEHGFMLNGKKLTIIGLNRHQNYPYVGPAMPKGGQREDADILKYQLGCNLVRTSHYSQSEDFLDRCDEIGLLAQTEVPGWQFVSKDPVWRKNFLDDITRMVLKEQNHPSLLAYGVRIDESPDDEELYSKANSICHKLDPHRLTTGVRNFKTSQCLEDFYCYNDFSCCGAPHGLDKPASVKGAKGKGILISENCGHMYPAKTYDSSDRRTNQALRHLHVINDAYKYSDYLGEIGWCAFDYNTHRDFGSGDHICYHGVSDIYRNPKAAGYAYLSQTATTPMMHVANLPLSGDNDEANIMPLVVFTNADSVKFFKNGKYVATFVPDKKDFPSLPHPPIIVDDMVGELFDEGYSKKDSRKIVRFMNYVSRTGYAHLTWKNYLPYLGFFLRKHITFEKLSGWFYKYESTWGEIVNTFEVKAYQGDKEVAHEVFSPSVRFDYDLKVSKTALVNADTYDVSRVSILAVDQNHHQLHYAFDPITFETQGPIQVLGPTTASIKGGSLAVYVRSLKTAAKTTAKLTLKTPLGPKTIEFSVDTLG